MANIALIFIVALAIVATILAQDAPQQQQQLPREVVEIILANASPPCRTELEAAMADGPNGQISNECKAEVQNIVTQLQQQMMQQQQQQQQQQQEQDFNMDEEYVPPKRADKPAAPKHDVTSTYLGVFGFVVACFAVIGGYVYLKAPAEASEPQKMKKLSRKKEEKYRRQGKI